LQVLFQIGDGDEIPWHQPERLDARLKLNEQISFDRPIQTEQEHSRRLIECRNAHSIPARRYLLSAEISVIRIAKRQTVLLILIEAVLKFDRQPVRGILRAS